MLNIVRIACLFCILTANPACAIEYIQSHVPNAQKVGEGRLSYMIWNVYDAALFAPDGQWDINKPYALRLTYLMNIKGKKIADRSIKEIRNQGFDDEIKLADWHAQMTRIFPDVNKDFILTGIYIENGETIFYENGYGIGRITDPEFGRRFFNIWLSEQTSAPDLRQKLLGNP